MMDDETLQMYVEESREHLEDIENDLLTIEEAGENIDIDLVNKVFRAAHSMKGGAGFLGLNNVKDLAHKIENVLDMVRNYELAPNPEIVNIVLLAFDRLSELVENIAESDDMDISEHVVALTGIATASVPEEEKDTIVQEIDIHDSRGRSVFSISEFDLKQARKGGKIVYLIEWVIVVEDAPASGSSAHDAGQEKEKDEFENLVARVESGEEVHEEKDDGKEEIVVTVEDIDAFENGSSGPEAAAAAPTSNDSKASSVQSVNKKSPAKAGSSTPAKPAAPKPKSKPKPAEAAPAKSQASAVPESLRVHVSLLENLMNLAGELVLSRNQLVQAISTDDERSVGLAGQRIDLVTSELQEAIMLTRMQSVANIFNKFPRVVRDLSQDLGKDIDLVLEGKDVELDKTIIEGLSDPLTHLVRNSADHGIETPDVRIAAGKKPQGQIILKAFHAAGQVNIEILDDGKGIPIDKIMDKALSKGLITEEQVKSMTVKDKNHLIFLPGLSTADQVSDVSGRGVGMDVVKSNLDRLGGQVDIESEEGKGTSIRIKLPLTLAIIPSLLISVAKDRFAIPQVNVDELIQLPPNLVSERIEKVGNAKVLILRGELIPLMDLSEVLKLDGTGKSTDFGSNITHINSAKNKSQSEEESKKELSEKDIQSEDEQKTGLENKGEVDIVVVSAGSFKYGLVVDELHDSVEIVVKPLGRHLKSCEGYAGATIMGDGRVALILDVVGLARLAELSSVAGSEKARELAKQKENELENEDRQSLFLFNNGKKEYCAVPLDLVARVELINADQIEIAGGKKVIQYRGGNLPIFALEEVAKVDPLKLEGELVVIVFFMSGHEVGLLASPPVDAVESSIKIDDFTLKQPGISGSIVLNGRTTLIVDIFEFMETLNPHWFTKRE
ncbi:MAG: chemotaxis protein CheW, partial [Desulfovibrionales bacterium]|nr:chemotaxis protein CheW [Desulfovibrionales bacterium]